MDISTDIWGQLAVEASQVYLSDGTMRSPFADTVDDYPNFHFALNTRSHSIYTHIPICISDHLSLFLSLRPLRSCPTRCCCTSSRIYLIARSVAWLASVVVGVRSPTIRACGRMSRCGRRSRGCMWVHWRCCYR